MQKNTNGTKYTNEQRGTNVPIQKTVPSMPNTSKQTGGNTGKAGK